MRSSGGSKSRLRGPRMVNRYQHYYVLLFSIILLGILVTGALQFWPHHIDEEEYDFMLRSNIPVREVVIPTDAPVAEKSDQSCTFHSCFDVYHCGYNDDSRISIYIYPVTKYLDESGVPLTLGFSQEFSELLQTVADSVYYTSEPDRACLFLPPLDLLNQNNLRLKESAQILTSLQSWNHGTNHLLFNMLPGNMPDFNTALDVHRGKAVLAGGGFSTWSYRRTYDVAIPVFSPLAAATDLPEGDSQEERTWLLMSAQVGLHVEYIEDLMKARQNQPRFIILQQCAGIYNMTDRCTQEGNTALEYPQVLQESEFCLVIRTSRLGQLTLSDAMKAGCVPVIVADSFILPFSEVIDWKRAAIVVAEDNLSTVNEVVRAISRDSLLQMRRQVRHLYASYFSSIRAITLTALQIINDRVFPYTARKYEEWNEPPSMIPVQNPLFLPIKPPQSTGFTAVILTYDRLESLFLIIQRVAQVPSLAKVLVVWNNQQKTPPPAAEWPKINKPLKVVQTRHNKLSNRFYPYDEIETEAILALDDDILMLTSDEVEFGYEVWREFPDRLVGFPSRVHLWDNSTHKWRYESEWTSAISMVLTGAAFHHKYYSYVYTNSLPGNIKTWVDDMINCEDIAMNFLIANLTGKASIKVAPRQKFKCPECPNLAMISADQKAHMVERSECVNRFVEIYGTMPLQSVEFRADPVLYKTEVAQEIKLFKDLGAL
ncbi:hypothetical protein CAPTEDRAFT_157657 [Capitella teleta]|uniref:Exostosin-2 n=1 Tax=Capitella teleta TaxID=283909 RepID=R7UWJ4_CAPTE|nr:hypothetical protein CAPTEDRAFT_157657 [Capitella teleta]|eukprot:ELU10993.1 hypothetical protein CAPTEDRAFT_157657 [Capitella teleta]